LLARRNFQSNPLQLNTSSAKEEALNVWEAMQKDSLTLGELAARYDVLQALSQGSVAVVYRANRRADGRQVALKVVRTVDEEMVDMARREFEVLRRIDHPHIIRAIEFITMVDRVLLVLDFFDGMELASAVPLARGRRLSEASAHLLFVQLLQAVAYLHRQKFVHRDVKPENVLVSSDLTYAKLVDFNTARSVEDGGALTMTGTMLYLAPEVLQGDSPSQEADVWASGLCLHFMVAGSLPQGRDKLAKAAMAELRTCSLLPPSFRGALWSGVSDTCKAVLARALAVDPRIRPTAADLLETEWLRAPL